MARKRARGVGRPWKSRFRIPLRINIILLFLLLFAILGLVLGAVASRSSQQLVDETVSTSFHKSASLALLELHQLQDTARSAADSLASNPIIETRNEEERSQQFHALATVLRAVPGVSAAYVGWPDGDFLLLRPVGRLEEQLDAPDQARWLAQWADSGGARFEFLNERLEVVEIRNDVEYDFDPRERPWYKGAQQSDETIVTSPYVFFTTREPGITAARRSQSGAVAGVDLSLWELSDRLQSDRDALTTEAAILDSQGSVLAYSDIGRLQEVVRSGVSEDMSTLEALPKADKVGPPVLATLSEQSKGLQEDFTGTLSVEGRDWLSTLVPLNGQGTTFVMAAPMQELAAGSRQLRTRLLQTFGIVMLFVIPVVWLAGRTLARPVERLASDVGRIAELDFSAPQRRQTWVKELEELNDSVEHLRLSLRERVTELRCLYDVLELTSDRSRSSTQVCRDIAQVLENSLIQLRTPAVRINVEGEDCLSRNWSAPVASYKAPIKSVYGHVGVIEAGPRDSVEAQERGEEVLMKEERDLIDGVADHLGRMLRSRQMAEELIQSERLRALGQLTGGVAHDFNNLLTIVLGNTEVLGSRLEDPYLRELAETAASAAERGAELTRRLLAFAGRQTLEPRLLNPNDLVVGLDALFQRTLREDIQITTDLAEEAWSTFVDPVLLEVALLNLVINARDAIASGGHVRLETSNVTFDAETAKSLQIAAGDYVMIAVADDGTGMPPEVEARAFEPFFTTKDIGQGSGLGLSMVYGFVRQSQGHVHIESRPGVGTTLRMYLPRSTEAAPPRSTTSPAKRSLPKTCGKLLIVEDDELLRGYAESQLENLGHQVVAVSNGDSALAELEAAKDFDLLFTDIVMPGNMDGRQLAARARELESGLKVLFTSGYAEEKIAQEEENLPPGTGILHKPYRRSELAQKIGKLLAAGS
ncbi:MAG: ATP-binding protein [Pseudomonadota bacterium]